MYSEKGGYEGLDEDRSLIGTTPFFTHDGGVVLGDGCCRE